MSQAPPGPVTYEQYGKAFAARAAFKLNGKTYLQTQYSIIKNAHGAADEATVVLSTQNNPDWSIELYKNADDTTPTIAEIYAGFPGDTSLGQTNLAPLSRRFYGILDSYAPTGKDGKMTFHLRNFAALLLDEKITTLAQNQTSVQFATQCAAEAGLKLVTLVIGTPATLAQVFTKDFVVGIKNLSKFEVLKRAAQVDDVDVWVEDDTLYYAAASLIMRQQIEIHYGRDLLDFAGNHAAMFSKNIKVEVRTYSPRTRVSHVTRVTTNPDGTVTKKSYTKTLTSTPVFGTLGGSTTTQGPGTTTTTGSSGSGGGFSSGYTGPGKDFGPEPYVFYIPNLTPQQANDRALKLWRQISMFEYQATFTLAATPTILPLIGITALLRHSGNPLAKFNSDYWPRRITETFEGASAFGEAQSNGWRFEVDCVNHTPPPTEI